MTDLAAQLTLARDVVRHFAAALAALHDDDLTPTVRSPSLQPPVSGSAEPVLPWRGDTGLRREVMNAVSDLHLAALALCELDCVEDPLPWDEPPEPDRRSLPRLTEIRCHLDHLDASLADVQDTHLPALGDREQALTACRLIIDSDYLTYQPKHAEDQPPPERRVRGRWMSLAAADSPTCHLCGKLDVVRRTKLDNRGQVVLNDRYRPVYERAPVPVVGRICARCRAESMGQDIPAVQAGQCVECGHEVQDRGRRCWACRQRRHRSKAS